MTVKTRTLMAYAFGLALASALTTGDTAAQTTPTGQAAPKTGMSRGMAADAPGQGMMADRQKMMADMQASQKKLDDLVAAMNAADGTAKVDRIAAVLTELVAEHRRMGTRMMSMGGMMTQTPLAQPAPGAAAPGPAPDAPLDKDHAAHHPKI